MITILESVVRLIYVLIALGVVVFVHELGHYLAAKKSGVKVEKFYLGIGPELFGFDHKGTRYGVAAFPVGGMVKLAGEDMRSENLSPQDFYYQPWHKRFFIAVSGALMNLVFAIAVFALIVKFSGVSIPLDEPVVGSLRENMPAIKAGLKVGDRIISVDGKAVKTWKDLAEYIHARPEVKILFEVERPASGSSVGIQHFYVTIIPIRSAESGGIGLIGINPPFKTEKAGWHRSVWLGANKSILLNYMTLDYLWESAAKVRKPELAGPVGIVGELARASRRGFVEFLGYLALISNALALFNLLPIPLLDGGLALLFVIEGVFLHKPLDEKIIIRINSIGLAFLLTIFLYATYGDVLRIFAGK